MQNVPENLLYTETHEWVKKNEDGSVTIGVTDHAQSLLGDLVFVELPAVSSALAHGDEVAVVESVKAASDVYSPLSGEVIAINQTLESNPEFINVDPYQKGWLFQLRLSDPTELDSLMKAQDYAAATLEKEEH